MSKVDGHENSYIPLRLHGDGTPVTGIGKQWGKLVDAYSIASLLVVAPTKLKTPVLRLKHVFNKKSLNLYNFVKSC